MKKLALLLATLAAALTCAANASANSAPHRAFLRAYGGAVCSAGCELIVRRNADNATFDFFSHGTVVETGCWYRVDAGKGVCGSFNANAGGEVYSFQQNQNYTAYERQRCATGAYRYSSQKNATITTEGTPVFWGSFQATTGCVPQQSPTGTPEILAGLSAKPKRRVFPAKRNPSDLREQLRRLFP